MSGGRWRERAADIRRAKASWGLGVSLVVVQLLLTVDPGGEWYGRLGLNRAGIANGQWWTLVTYGGLHAGWGHLGMNLTGLLLLGGGIERIDGPRRLLRVFLAGILAGGISHLLLFPRIDLLVGASGGVAAMLLWLTGVAPNSRVAGLGVSAGNLGLGVLLASLLLAIMDPANGWPGLSLGGRWLAGQLGNGIFTVSHACHFGGALAGWGLARWLLRPRVSLQQLRKRRDRSESKGL